MSSKPKSEPGDKPVKRKVSRNQTLETRLYPEDYERFDRLWRLEGKPKAEILRDAVRDYLDRKENELVGDRETKLEKLIKNGIDRMTKMQARACLDIGTIYYLAYNNLPQETRDEIWAKHYSRAVSRLRNKISQQEQEIKELGA